MLDSSLFRSATKHRQSLGTVSRSHPNLDNFRTWFPVRIEVDDCIKLPDRDTALTGLLTISLVFSRFSVLDPRFNCACCSIEGCHERRPFSRPKANVSCHNFS